MRNIRDSLRLHVKETNAANVKQHKDTTRIVKERINAELHRSGNVTRYGIDSKLELMQLANNADSVRLADPEHAASSNMMEYRLFAQRDDSDQELLIQRLCASKELRKLSAIEQRKRAKSILAELNRQAGINSTTIGLSNGTTIGLSTSAVQNILSKDNDAAPITYSKIWEATRQIDDAKRKITLPSSLHNDIPITRRAKSAGDTSITRRFAAMPERYRIGGTLHNVKVDDTAAALNRLRNNMMQHTKCDASTFES